MRDGFKAGAPGALAKKKKDVDSDLELEDYHELIEKMELDDVLDSVKKQVKKTTETYKQNFLVQFFERTESQLEAQRHDEEFMKRPAMLKTRKPDPNDMEETKEPPKTRSPFKQSKKLGP